ncbi:zinc-ribbon domain containing protein [Enterococcus sp.]|uniref:zinc-ribbon domain containing protein n=1 Tax=Enterococcus sp. TaxID=35783 RepID=UPI00289DA373|nr:zinc-ribbon domain containing protein [Enterococcus sp.]
MFEDKTLICKDCGDHFTFTAGEQEFYAEHGYENEPKRCKPCRDTLRRAAREGTRHMHNAICTDCGQPCKVPFNPAEDRPVYCEDCLAEHRNGR